MKKSKLIGKIMCLTLAIALVVSIVPAISTKAASSGWIKLTSENKATMDENLSDVSTLFYNGKEEYIKAFEIAYNAQSSERYIIGKKGTDYVYYDSWIKDLACVTEDKIDQNTYYYHPQYTVTFDLNGGNLAVTTDKTAGGLLTSMPSPTKEGYIFTGWFSTLQGTEGLGLYKEYNASTTIYAHWHKWTGDETWVRATTISDLENADLPIFTSSVGKQFLNTHYTADSFPEDADEVIIGKFYKDGVYYWTTSKETDASGKLSTSFYPYNETLAENMRDKIFYVLKDPNAVAPAPATPAPGTQTPSNSAPSTSMPTTGNTSNTSSASEAPAPVLTTTNLAGEQISGWDAITKAISTQTKEKQQSVSGANQDLLHVDASTVDKTIPVTTVKAVSSSSLRGLHVFIGSSDAVTFLAKNDLSGYKETSFDHKDTITGHTRTIEFTHKQALGATVVFHTTVPVKSGEVTVYKVDANNNKIQIAKTISTVNGQVCFPITETATYVLEY